MRSTVSKNIPRKVATATYDHSCVVVAVVAASCVAITEPHTREGEYLWRRVPLRTAWNLYLFAVGAPLTREFSAMRDA
jgi:hypothetical protein